MLIAVGLPLPRGASLRWASALLSTDTTTAATMTGADRMIIILSPGTTFMSGISAVMPWRRTKDPYRILLAEYILQRTRVASGLRYYERFLERFPTIEALAAAPEDEVLRAWEGLGYYRRARNLRAAAQAIVRDHGGCIPPDAAGLAALPGIGPYTAGAVASIAFGERTAAVDGNVTRVVSRLFQIEEDVTRPAGRVLVRQRAEELVSAERPGAFNQAMMELGATMCVPRRPLCPTCPLADVCLARAAGMQTSLPRTPPPRSPKTVSVAFAVVQSRGRTLLVRRGDSGLLAGLWSLPGGEVPSMDRGRATLRELVLAQTGLRVSVGESLGAIDHAFSHRRWVGTVLRAAPRGRGTLRPGARWVTPAEARDLPLVPDHRKILDRIQRARPLESFTKRRRRPS